MPTASANLINQTDAGLIPLPDCAERAKYGLSTLRRHIKAGHLPAVKIKGRVYVRTDDLDAFVAPEPMVVADDTLKDWAERMATKAPAFRPEQRAIILSAFTSALRGA